MKILFVLLALGGFGCASVRTPVALATPQSSSYQDPAHVFSDLFVRVQTGSLFADSKYFVDMVPREEPAFIMREYRQKRPATREELLKFIELHFAPPSSASVAFKSASGVTIETHIKALWSYLKREPAHDLQTGSSLVPLSSSYVVPGGRFREVYYWDSYFTQLGLLADKEDALFQSMVQNFAELVLKFGFIPNGNRSYYLDRSQPPFFSYMVSLWQEHYGDKSAAQFLPALKKEYTFWMKADSRAVKLADGFLNRYWSDKAEPRSESYKEDVATADQAVQMLKRNRADVYRDLRAAAESGWDFSTRWFAKPNELASIQTTSLLPVDLNALLYHLETTIADLSKVAGEATVANQYREFANARRALMQKYFWDEEQGAFCDYNWRESKHSDQVTLATVVPLFTGVATNEQAKRVQLAECQKIAPVVCIQNMYNIAQRGDDAFIKDLTRQGIAYVPYFPLGGFSPLQSSTLNTIATSIQSTPMQVALAWLLQRSPNILLIPGTSSVKHLRENLKAGELKLTPEMVAELDLIGAV